MRQLRFLRLFGSTVSTVSRISCKFLQGDFFALTNLTKLAKFRCQFVKLVNFATAFFYLELNSTQ